jgi:uncharacterized protein (TIGR00369 family)
MGRDMTRWLGDGGMPIIAGIGAGLTAFGEGWAAGTWTPTDLACNPAGTVQAGVHGVVLDAAMNFAINAGLDGKDRTRGTLEMKIETMRPAPKGETFSIRGDVVRMAKQIAYAEAAVRDADGRFISRSTGTFFLHRENGA